MRLYNYLNEKFVDYPDIRRKDVENVVKDWLKLNPDVIKFNDNIIDKSQVDLDVIKDKNDIITIKKGDVGVQIYKDNNKLRTRKIQWD